MWGGNGAGRVLVSILGGEEAGCVEEADENRACGV